MAGSPVQVVGIDHIVLRCTDPEAHCLWYQQILGLEPVRLEEWRQQKVPFPSARVSPSFLIDFFPISMGHDASTATQKPEHSNTKPGINFDHLCLEISGSSLEEACKRLEAHGVKVENQFDGKIVKRFGARGNATSIYIKDPDNYTVELRTYAPQ
ncbi:hypothetical protein WJX72_008029 [[Myrmecia] bisecta]|uniref:VOC domain-containing protein n=1 Tax=[Myrmecia] bisecta TaxID=41462 RepID=A0AAW1PFN0_9CHLO